MNIGQTNSLPKTIPVEGKHHIRMQILPTVTQFYFSDETTQLHGPWLTIAEAEAQRDHYARSL